MIGLAFFMTVTQAGSGSFFGGFFAGNVMNRVFYPQSTFRVVHHVAPVRTIVYDPVCCYRSSCSAKTVERRESHIRLQQAQAEVEELEWQNRKLTRKIEKLKQKKA